MAERSEAVDERAVRDGSAAYAVEPEIASAEYVPPGYKRTEVGVIPEDWSFVKLGCVMANIIDFRGRTPKKLGMNWGGGDIPALSARNVKMGKIDFREETYYGSEKLYKRWMTNGHVEKGNVVVTMEAPLGNVALILDNQRYILSQRTILLQPDSSLLLGEFLSQLLSSPWFQKVLHNNGTGSTATGIQRRRFERLDIPCPRITEQRAIATALSDADALIDSLGRLIAKKRAIKQAAMQQLLTGQTRLPGFTGEWETKRLGDVAEIRSGGTPSTAMPTFWNGGVPWCTPTDITALRGRKYLSETERTISHAGLQASSAESIPPQSIIMTTRATIGECAINTVPMTTNQGFKNLIPLSANTEFLYYLMTTKKGELIQLCGGSTFLEIGKKQLHGFELMIPQSREEQEAIATVLSDMDTDIGALQRRRDKANQIKQGMMQQLLTGRVRLVTPETTEPAIC